MDWTSMLTFLKKTFWPWLLDYDIKKKVVLDIISCKVYSETFEVFVVWGDREVMEQERNTLFILKWENRGNWCWITW